MSARDKMADDDYDTIKMNHCPMFDGTHMSFQKWGLWFEIYAITNRFYDAISKDDPEADFLATSNEFTLSSDEKKRKVQKRRHW